MKLLVHILLHGSTLCGRSGVPSTWDPEERWTYVEDASSANCAGCLRKLERLNQPPTPDDDLWSGFLNS